MQTLNTLDVFDNRLYCLMRTDLASMNPGKAIAQGMHAQAEAEAILAALGGEWTAMWTAWKLQAGHFGTTVTLGGAIDDIHTALVMLGEAGFPCGVVHDPTYPLLDGRVMHLIPLDTCAWTFGSAFRLKPLLVSLSLHP